jgi:hypothetical protein
VIEQDKENYRQRFQEGHIMMMLTTGKNKGNQQ